MEETAILDYGRGSIFCPECATYWYTDNGTHFRGGGDLCEEDLEDLDMIEVTKEDLEKEIESHEKEYDFENKKYSEEEVREYIKNNPEECDSAFWVMY